VEGRNPHLPAFGAQQRLNTRPHFFGGLVGERHGEDAVRIRDAAADQMRDAMRNDARLARSCTGENQQGAVRVKNGFLLFWIETGEEVQASILP
jgi:hypothetical protein